MENIILKSQEIEKQLLCMRKELHRIPEIGNELPKTVAFVCARLEELGVPYLKNEKDGNIIAEIKGEGEGGIIAFRADMDALHIQERTELPFASSIEGQMHACGHDVHTAILLACAEVLCSYKKTLKGTVRLIFQVGEETGTGAKEVLAEGGLNGVDAIWALHVGNLAGDDLMAGQLVVLDGPVSAGKDKFTVTVHGKGTHSAFPEKGIDPILISARIVNACEELIAREVGAGTAAVLSFGSLQAGLDHNSIPETALIKGSIRCQDEEIRTFLGERLKTICGKIAEAFRGSCTVELKKGSSTIMNNPSLAQFTRNTLRKAFGDNSVVGEVKNCLMGSDDFYNYAKTIPAVYFFLHTNNPEKGIIQPNHNPCFDVDEEVLWKGVAAYVAIALEYMK